MAACLATLTAASWVCHWAASMDHWTAGKRVLQRAAYWEPQRAERKGAQRAARKDGQMAASMADCWAATSDAE